MTALSSESLNGLLPALIAAQAAFKPAKRDAKNEHYGTSYSSLNATLSAVLPALNANGLALVQHVVMEEPGNMVLLTRLYHASGEWLSSEYPVSPIRSDPQSCGSALTYARRYAAMALVGIAPEDDDGEAASGPLVRPQTARRPDRPQRALQPTQVHVDAEAGAAELADAMDNATTEAQLTELAKTLQTLPEFLLPPLREHFANARDRIRARKAPDLFREESVRE